MSDKAQEAGRKAAIVSAQAGTPLKTAYDSGYSQSSASYDKGVAQGQQQVSENRGR